MSKESRITSRENSELRAAAALLIERAEEERRKLREEAAEQKRAQLANQRNAVQKMQRSIEVIKWCVVCVSIAYLMSFIAGIVVLIKVRQEVKTIETQVDSIRHRLENPFATAGERLGGDLDDRLKKWLGISSEEREGE